MVKTNAIKSAEKLFAAQKYDRLISYLIPQIFKFRGNPRFFYLLAYSCFFTGDFVGAESYFRRVLDLHEYGEDVKLVLAAIQFRREEYDKALEMWLSITDKNPKNKYANRGLSILKKYGDNPGKYRDVPHLYKLTPKPDITQKRISLKKLGYFLFAALLLSAIILISNYKDEIVSFFPLQSTVSLRPGPQELIITDNVYIDHTRSARYQFSDKEILELYKTAEQYFHQYKDNVAQKYVNRILHSNANLKIREQALHLSQFFTTPGFENFSDSYQYQYQTILDDPILYNNCYIKWTGRVANIISSDTRISFEFLVGYDQNQILLGIVPAYMDFTFVFNKSESYEIIAQIEADENSFQLRVSSIRIIRN